MTLCRERTHLNGADARVLCRILVLVKAILGQLPFLQLNAELNEEEHDRLERRDSARPGPLGGDMLVEHVEGGRRLPDSDELLGPLENILGLGVHRRRHLGCENASFLMRWKRSGSRGQDMAKIS